MVSVCLPADKPQPSHGTFEASEGVEEGEEGTGNKGKEGKNRRIGEENKKTVRGAGEKS